MGRTGARTWVGVGRAVAVRIPLRAARRLPGPLAVPLLARRARPRADTADHESIPLPGPLTLDTYWLRSSTGAAGPAASVHLGVEELLRIDGLRGGCHVHYDLAASRARGASAVAARRPIGDDEIAGWAADELRLNLRYALSQDRRRRVRRLRLDEEGVTAAAERVRTRFEELLDRHGAAPPIR